MKTLTKKLLFTIFLVSSVSLLGFSTAQAAPKYSLKIGTVESATGSNTIAWNVFKQYVESNTNQDIKIDIYPAGQLGDTEKLLEGLQLGIHKMAQGDESITGTYKPMMAWFAPYMFRDELSMKQFFESSAFSKLNDQMAKDIGVRSLAATPYGFYNFINRSKPIKKLEDLKGLKLRTLPNSQITIKAWSALGASATPVPWSEIYTSIRTGVIDGLGHTLGIMTDQKYYEVAKYVTIDNSMGVANLYLINEKFYQSLPDNYKSILKKGAEIAANVEFGLATNKNRLESIEILKKHNVEIHTLDSAERARFKETALAQVLPWLREVSGSENVDAVLNAVKEIEQ